MKWMAAAPVFGAIAWQQMGRAATTRAVTRANRHTCFAEQGCKFAPFSCDHKQKSPAFDSPAHHPDSAKQQLRRTTTALLALALFTATLVICRGVMAPERRGTVPRP